MPKKNKKGKNNAVPPVETKLLEKDDWHAYGTAMKRLGCGKFSIKLVMQEKEVIGRLAGKLRHGAGKKFNYVNIGSVVLVGMRDFQENMVDIVYVYEPGEVRQLKKSGQYVEETGIPADTHENVQQENVDDTGFEFDQI